MTQEIRKIVSAKSIFLSELFNDLPLFIPAYQRPYSWEVREARELWNDIYNCYEESGQHFIGPMYFKSVHIDSDAMYEVTDGQQRITSIFLLLMAFKRLLKNDFNNPLLQENEELKSIQYLIDVMTRKRNKPRLVLGASDRDSFKKITENFDTIPTSLKQYKMMFHQNNQIFLRSAQLLYENFFYFYKELKAIVDSDYKLFPGAVPGKNNAVYLNYQKEELKKIHLLLLTVSDRFSLIKCIIETTDESRVFKLFETINDRGRQLDNVDKIKNYLFMNVYQFYKDYKPEELNEVFLNVQKLWAEMQENLDIYIGEYVRYYLIAENVTKQFIKVNDLYLVLHTYIESQLQYSKSKDDYKRKEEIAIESFKLLENLHKYRMNYNQIIDPVRTEFFKDVIIRSNLKYGGDYKIVRALYLKLLMDFQKNSNPNALNRLRKMVIVTTNAALLYIGIFELKKMDNVEQEIYKMFFHDHPGENLLEVCIDYSEKLYQAMTNVSSKFVWDDQSLTDRIANCTNDDVSFVIQCKLNDYKVKIAKTGDYFYPKTLVDSVEGYALNKDHILPQKPNMQYQMVINDYYSQLGEEVPIEKNFRKDVISRLGNIIPIMRETNINLSNGPHLSKFNALPTQGILLVELLNRFGAIENWLPSHISDRSQMIAKDIVDTNSLSLDEHKVCF